MIYIFDVDGTLTKSRNKMDLSFAQFFYDFTEHNRVWLISGSDKDKTIEQVGGTIWHKVERAYQCSGNQLFQNGKLIKENKFELPIQAEVCLEAFLKDSKYPHRFGNHIEKRPGMVNFSVVGRDCTQEQREEYFKWDKKNREREFNAWEIRERFNFLDAVVGGEISIDIYNKGQDKGQILKDIDDNFTFFGDKLDQGGNDYPIHREIIKRKLKGNKTHHVKGWKDTQELLYSI